jgi:hypothetical protein
VRGGHLTRSDAGDVKRRTPLLNVTPWNSIDVMRLGGRRGCGVVDVV